MYEMFILILGGPTECQGLFVIIVLCSVRDFFLVDFLVMVESC